MDGDDLRPLPLSMQGELAKLLHRRPSGIFLGGFEQSEIGPDLFRRACLSQRPLERLDQDQKPLAPRDGASEGFILNQRH
jgi:hypothetical protein